MNEAGFTSGVNTDVRKCGVPFVWKVNDRTTGGIPDARYRGPKAELWIEYKFLTLKKVPDTVKNELSDKQKVQITIMRNCGDVIWVVYGIKQNGKSLALVVDATDLYADRFNVLEVLPKKILVDNITTWCGTHEHAIH